jgi:hypothetical protein
MSIAALVLGVIGYLVLAAAVLAKSPILAWVVITLSIAGLLLLACDYLKTANGDPVNGRPATDAAIERTRIFRSQLLAPRLECGYLWLTRWLPSTRIRMRFEPPLPDPHGEKQRVENMSRWLEWYLLATTALLIGLVWSQSHEWAWRHSALGWALRVLVVAAFVVRISEILSQSIEVVLNRIDADAASGLTTLVIYVIQAVAIFAIWSEYAAYASGYASGAQAAFKDFGGSIATGCLQYAYVAWANLVTFGTAYAPQTSWAKVVVVCSGLTFILLFSVLLAFVMDRIRPPDRDDVSPTLGGH